MRCKACNAELTDYEATKKYSGTRVYVDLCGYCYHGLGIRAEDRPDLPDSVLIDEEHEVSFIQSQLEEL